MFEKLQIAGHFIRARWLSKFRTREQLLVWQKRRLSTFLGRITKEYAFYAGLPPQIEAFPISDKTTFLAHFAELNKYGITLEAATAHGLRAERDREFTSTLSHQVTVGLSSGTSGQRGVFLVSPQEQTRWAGLALARSLSAKSLRQLLNPFAPALKIAFFLRSNSNLYKAIGSQRTQFRYFDLLEDLQRHTEELARFQPDILIAPATVLAELANRPGIDIKPSQIISVAEVLDQQAAALIEARFGLHPSEIYQATEGFLGSTCEAGRIHLNEENLFIEYDWLDQAKTRFTPIITDFSRSTQVFVRHRLDDILRIGDSSACPCGRPSQTVAAIEGRKDEVLRFAQPVFPETLRQALYGIPSPLGGYRIEQRGADLHVRLQIPVPKQQEEIVAALTRMFTKLGMATPPIQFSPWKDHVPGEKQRRIHCLQPL